LRERERKRFEGLEGEIGVFLLRYLRVILEWIRE